MLLCHRPIAARRGSMQEPNRPRYPMEACSADACTSLRCDPLDQVPGYLDSRVLPAARQKGRSGASSSEGGHGWCSACLRSRSVWGNRKPPGIHRGNCAVPPDRSIGVNLRRSVQVAIACWAQARTCSNCVFRALDLDAANCQRPTGGCHESIRLRDDASGSARPTDSLGHSGLPRPLEYSSVSKPAL